MSLGIYAPEELRELGIRTLGENVRIDRSCRLFGAQHMLFGSHVRIDANAVLSASEQGFVLGNFIHISTGVSIVGRGRFQAGNFVNVSVRVAIFTSNDDYSGEVLVGPMVDSAYTNVHTAPVVIEDHVVVGASSVLLPGVTLHRGSAVGALSLVKQSVPEFFLVAGRPAAKIRERSLDLLELERRFLESLEIPP